MSAGGRKFEIIHHSRDDDSYMYSDTDYYWYVRSVQTGDELASYSGYHNESSAGTSTGGARSVRLNEDNLEVSISHYDGKTDILELPENITIVDGGKAILLIYQDGREEKRPRRAVTITTKYGQPIRHPLKDQSID